MKKVILAIIVISILGCIKAPKMDPAYQAIENSPTIGIVYRNYLNEHNEVHYPNISNGLVISRLARGSDGFNKLKTGQIITEVNGIPLVGPEGSDSKVLSNALKNSDSVVELTIFTGTDYKKITIVKSKVRDLEFKDGKPIYEIKGSKLGDK